MANEALFCVTGYVATQPVAGFTRSGVPTLSMRVGWTPRRLDRNTGEWADEATSFASVKCFRKTAQNAAACLRRGDPIFLKGSLRVREYQDQAGTKRTSVDVIADVLGHDVSRGVSLYTKAQASLAMTALEHIAAEAAAGRAVLPGDRRFVESGDPDDSDAVEASDERSPGAIGEDSPDGVERADGAGMGSGEGVRGSEGISGGESIGGESIGGAIGQSAEDDELFDEEEAIEILAGEAEPAAAPM